MGEGGHVGSALLFLLIDLSLQAETIRRAKPMVGEEIVDIEYRIFDGLTMLSAEHVVETMNRLSEAELVSTMKYGVSDLFVLSVDTV